MAEPTASNTLQSLAETPLLKFPPFPEPPPAVTIMPFKDFKPRGIQLFSESRKGKHDLEDEEDAELDALGIPTVELRVKHATDACKSNARKKRKKKKTTTATEAVKKVPWYEEWEQGEDLRVTKVCNESNASPADRLFQSSYDFRTGRPWPPISSGLNNLWDQFRLFTGLLINPSVFRKVGTKKLTRAESPDFDSDDDEGNTVTNVRDGGATGDSRHTKRQRSDEDLNGDEQSKMDEELREEKISHFLNDPEKAVRIFLSSFMREHGLIWAERNLIFAPRLVYFFLAFVLRNHVVQEPAYQRGLRQALETIKLAKKELPMTYKVGQSIPDTFNEACRECFGRQGGMNWSVVTATTIETENRDGTITVADISDGTPRDVALPTEAQMQLKDAIEDNVDMNVSLDTLPKDVTPMHEDGWGGGWGDEGSWSQNSWAQRQPWDEEGQEMDGKAATDSFQLDSKWADSNPTWNRDPVSLFSLLGPSAFPLTHTTGIVECSTRRVSAIHFPPNYPRGASLPSLREIPAGTAEEASDGLGWKPSASGVEAELEARFAQIILEPWGREEGDISGPEIWATSRGPVIDLENPSKEVSAEHVGSTARKPHNPLIDNITLLVKPSFAETLALVPGLGLGAMWIEIVRQQSGTRGGGVAEVDFDTPGRFWYHEDVTGIFPSFYTPRVKE